MTIDFDQAIRVPFDERHNLPKASGVYVVKQNDAALYVGQSKNIYKRWKARHTQTPVLEQRGEGVEIFCFLVPASELEDVELHFIRTLRPSLNKLLTYVSTEVDEYLDFHPLPSDPAQLTRADALAVFGGDIDGGLRDLVSVIRTQSQRTTQSDTQRNGAQNGQQREFLR